MSRSSYFIFLITISTVLCSLAVDLHAQKAGFSDLQPEISAKDTDTISISLMTCEPGQQIYELYGHTAIRIQNTATREDWAFNYGMFNFHTPNFVFRFLRGQTDYMLGVYPFGYFLDEYGQRGSVVYEQPLNLTPLEKARLYDALCMNARPENRTYRYNYLYNNCTSQARDIMERCIDGKIEYTPDNRQETFRQIIHRHTKGSPWSEFGQDLLMGAEVDRPISQRLKMFAPLYLKEYAEQAIILSSNGTKRPLVKETRMIKPYREMEIHSGFPISPTVSFSILLAITVILSIIELRQERIFWAWEIILMLVQGISGCIITFLFFFSEHPAVNTNWLIIILNPIPIIYIIPRIRKLIKHRHDIYSPIAFTVTALFLIATPIIPQSFSGAVCCFTLSLCTHSAVCSYLQRKLQWKRTV